MTDIKDGDLVADADDEAAAEFKAELDAAIVWLGNAQAGWDGLTNAQKQAWLVAYFDRVLLVLVRLLRFVRWWVKR